MKNRNLNVFRVEDVYPPVNCWNWILIRQSSDLKVFRAFFFPFLFWCRNTRGSWPRLGNNHRNLFTVHIEFILLWHGHASPVLQFTVPRLLMRWQYLKKWGGFYFFYELRWCTSGNSNYGDKKNLSARCMSDVGKLMDLELGIRCWPEVQFEGVFHDLYMFVIVWQNNHKD